MDEQRPVLAALRGGLVGHLQRGFDGRGPVAGVEDPAQPGWCGREQRLRELDAGLVGQPEERRVREPVELRPDRGVDGRLAMTVHGDPQRGDAVEVAPAVGVDQVHALGRGDDERVVARPHRVLGERMPDVREVGGDQVRRGTPDHARILAGRPGVAATYPDGVGSGLADILARLCDLEPADSDRLQLACRRLAAARRPVLRGPRSARPAAL